MLSCGAVGGAVRRPGVARPERRPTNGGEDHAAGALRQMVEVGLIRRPRVKARVRALSVVERQIPADRGACLGDAVVGSQVDLFILDRTPEPLDEHVVAPGAAAVHADRNITPEQQASESGAGELASLIGVEDFRPAMLTCPPRSVPPEVRLR